MAASTLLGVGETTLNLYISPTSAASKIQYAYRHYLIRRNRILLPCLRGTYKSRIGCTVATEEWAADMKLRIALNWQVCTGVGLLFRWLTWSRTCPLCGA